MNRRIWIIPIAFITSLLLTSVCSIIRHSESGRVTQATRTSANGIEGVYIQRADVEGCPDPFEGFEKAILIGTWQAGFGYSMDALVFREDGFCRRIPRVETLDFHVENDRQHWRVTS